MKNLILLNGPSLKDAVIDIEAGDRIFAVNRKAKVEEKIGRHVNFWFVFSPTEFDEMIEEIYTFLNRSEENRLITHSAALATRKDYLEARPLPNAHRVIVIDEVFSKMSKTALEINPKIKDVEACWNSVSIIINLLAIADPATTSFIYGMDGAASENQQALYFNQSELTQKRLGQNRIFADMVFFDQYFMPVLTKQGLNPRVWNMNCNSFYQSIPKIKDWQITRRDASEVSTLFPHLSYSSKELLEKAQDLLHIQNKHLLERMFVRMKKQHLLKRLFNRKSR